MVLDVAGRGDDEVRPYVVLFVQHLESLSRHALDRILRTEDRAPVRVPLPKALGVQFEDEVVGRVVDLCDLFEDDFALELQVLLAEERVEYEVGQNV